MAAEVKEHGRSGYRKGCKCGVCRSAHAEYMAGWRSRRRSAEEAIANADAEPLVDVRPLMAPAATPSTLDMSAEPGPLEQALLDDVAEPDSRVAFRRHLMGLARLNARVLDQVSDLDRLDLISPLQLRQTELLGRLAILGFAGMDERTSSTPTADAAEDLLRQMEHSDDASGG